MLHSLKFVQGAIDKDSHIPEMTHFRIYGGRITAKNPVMTISCPISMDIDCSPCAKDFVKAISECDDKLAISLTKAGKLSIKSGPFKALIKCIDSDRFNSFPEGEIHPINGEVLIKALSLIIRFVSVDKNKQRLWSRGILFKDSSVFATNGACLVEYYIGQLFTFICNVPVESVKEIIRVKEFPNAIQVGKNSVTFHYPGDKWIKTQLYDANWPDISRIINIPSGKQITLNKAIFDGMKKLKAFSNEYQSIYFHDGYISTTRGNVEGSSFEVPGLPAGAIFDADIFMLLNGVVETIDLSRAPNPCAFTGNLKEHPIRGVIMPMRDFK